MLRELDTSSKGLGVFCDSLETFTDLEMLTYTNQSVRWQHPEQKMQMHLSYSVRNFLLLAFNTPILVC